MTCQEHRFEADLEGTLGWSPSRVSLQTKSHKHAIKKGITKVVLPLQSTMGEREWAK